MLPNSFLPWRFQAFAVKDDSDSARNNELHGHVQAKLSALEKTILSGKHYAGVAKNSLLEETDKHIKERLLCAAKIAALTAVINEICEQEKLSPADLHMLIEDKTSAIRLKEDRIWLNQLTQEKNWPLFYSFED
ncbi:hypothetical protein [Cedecea colo]|uniref:Uncharacterized protein n=1 Tax=Cedecea colo TaxID=2552946 RepID=A0ABX0VNM8_9ENTR|nr:hypothetical protein [Cedecea colo]NIY47827.1 hypothetical protein [Cedecea colo]